MASNGSAPTPLRIVVGCDQAGVLYKDALKKALEQHKGVKEVLDVGVKDEKDDKAYPHSAVEAARKIKNGEVGSLIASHVIAQKIY